MENTRGPFQCLVVSRRVPRYTHLPDAPEARTLLLVDDVKIENTAKTERELSHRVRVDLITAFKVFTSASDVAPKLCFFLPPSRRGLRGHPYKLLHDASHRRRRRSAFSVRDLKYWNKLSVSVVTAPSVKIFKGWITPWKPHSCI